jgi:hypothetical protein
LNQSTARMMESEDTHRTAPPFKLKNPPFPLEVEVTLFREYGGGTKYEELKGEIIEDKIGSCKHYTFIEHIKYRTRVTISPYHVNSYSAPCGHGHKLCYNGLMWECFELRKKND